MSPLWRLSAGIIGCLIGLVLYVRWLSVPWSVGNQVSQDVHALQLQWSRRRLTNLELQKRLTHLRSPVGIEALARSRGYHRPGEQVYLEPRPVPVRKFTSEKK